MTRPNEGRDDELDLRARDVLREIVMQYIEHGEPISSRSLAKLGHFNLSPASLRNVMADLEDLGYVYQPHTSAGRVPTDRGYRFFINHLMRSKKLMAHEREVIDDQVGQANDVEGLMHLASRLVSKLSDQVGVVFLPSLHQLSMRSIDFVLVGERKILCVLVGTNGVVVNKMIDSPTAFTRDELERIGRQITAEYGGKTVGSIRQQLLSLLNEERAQVDELIKKMATLGIDAVGNLLPEDRELFVEGAASILNKPEFADADSLRKTLLAFDEREKLVEILNLCLSEDGLQIVIGSESRFTQSYNFSIVAARYGSLVSPIGLVGVIGPTRMEYSRVAPLVDYIGRALSRKIEESQEQNS